MDGAAIARLLSPFEANCLRLRGRGLGSEAIARELSQPRMVDVLGGFEVRSSAGAVRAVDVERAFESARAKLETAVRRRRVMELACACGEAFTSRGGETRCPACRAGVPQGGGERRKPSTGRAAREHVPEPVAPPRLAPSRKRGGAKRREREDARPKQHRRARPAPDLREQLLDAAGVDHGERQRFDGPPPEQRLADALERKLTTEREGTAVPDRASIQGSPEGRRRPNDGGGSVLPADAPPAASEFGRDGRGPTLLVERAAAIVRERGSALQRDLCAELGIDGPDFSTKVVPGLRRLDGLERLQQGPGKPVTWRSVGADVPMPEPQWDRERVIDALAEWMAENGREVTQTVLAEHEELPSVQTVRRHCGSLVDGVAYAKRRLPEEARAQLEPPPVGGRKPEWTRESAARSLAAWCRLMGRPLTCGAWDRPIEERPAPSHSTVGRLWGDISEAWEAVRPLVEADSDAGAGASGRVASSTPPARPEGASPASGASAPRADHREASPAAVAGTADGGLAIGAGGESDAGSASRNGGPAAGESLSAPLAPSSETPSAPESDGDDFHAPALDDGALQALLGRALRSVIVGPFGEPTSVGDAPIPVARRWDPRVGWRDYFDVLLEHVRQEPTPEVCDRIERLLGFGRDERG